MILALRDDEIGTMSYGSIDDYHRMALVIELEANRRPDPDPVQRKRILAAAAVSKTIQQGEVI